MSKWKQLVLRDVADVRDGTHDSPKETIEGKYLVTSRHIKGGKVDLSKAYRISEQDFEQVNRRSKVERWDILFSMIGTIGEMALIDYEPDFAIKNVGLFKTGNEDLARWIYYYFKSDDAQNEIYSSLKGSTQEYITLGDLRKFPIVLPLLPEQKAIASVLSSLDDKIDLLHRQNKTLEAMAETLFRQWFVEEAQEDWVEGKVSELIDVLSGFAFKSSSFVENGIFMLMTIKAVQDGYLETANAARINDVPSKMPDYCHLQEGDILLSLTGNVGRCCLVDAEKLLLNQRVAKLKPKNLRDFAFVYVMFRQSSMKASLEEMAKGTAQANLSPVEMSNMEMMIPPDRVLSDFSQLATPYVKKILFNKRVVNTLEKLRDTLLPKLMSGEVRVEYEN